MDTMLEIIDTVFDHIDFELIESNVEAEMSRLMAQYLVEEDDYELPL